MAQYRGTIQGARGEASRLGGKESGLHVTAASWQGAVRVDLFEANGVDIACVRLQPHHGQGTSRILYEGPVSGKPQSKRKCKQQEKDHVLEAGSNR